MFDTMREYSGVGLAAPQVHEGVRLFVAGLRAGVIGEEVGEGGEMPLMALVNPEITLLDEPTHVGWEGCLSIPDIRGRVPRATKVRVKALDRTGKPLRFTAHGFSARVIQHEYDHLDGILFFDRMGTLESLTYLEEYNRHWVRDDDDDELDDESEAERETGEDE